MMTLELYEIGFLSCATTIIGWLGGFYFMAKKYDRLEVDLFRELRTNEDLREVIHVTAGAEERNVRLSGHNLSGAHSSSACDCA